MMRLSPEGWPTILLVTGTVCLVGMVSVLTHSPALGYAVIPLLLLDALIVYFFRDPERTVPDDSRAVVAPADGRVVLIQDVTEERFLQGPAKQISIFLSVFDVHVNRIPLSGTVRYVAYNPGRFLAAFKDAASLQNEQTMIGIDHDQCRVAFKQIAGLLARRIVCHVKAEDQVRRGERFGIIKFGSRVDMFFPPTVEITVRVGDRVRGGQSVVARLRS